MEALLGSRRTKDKSYKNVFKGSVLVSTLMDHDKSRFANRQAAVKFAQKLLECGHVESIVGSNTFEDSVHLYRWSDETVVREAKKMVNTASSHIPKKKLIELVDLQHGDNAEDQFVMKDVKEKLFKGERSGSVSSGELPPSRPPPPVPGSSTGSVSVGGRRVRRERASRRQTVAGDAIPASQAESCSVTGSQGSLNADPTKSADDSNLLRSSSLSSDGISVLGGDATLKIRTASPVSTTGSETSETRASSVASDRLDSVSRARSSDTESTRTTSTELSLSRVRSPDISGTRTRTHDSACSSRSRTPDPDHAGQLRTVESIVSPDTDVIRVRSPEVVPEEADESSQKSADLPNSSDTDDTRLLALESARVCSRPPEVVPEEADESSPEKSADLPNSSDTDDTRLLALESARVCSPVADVQQSHSKDLEVSNAHVNDSEETNDLGTENDTTQSCIPDSDKTDVSELSNTSTVGQTESEPINLLALTPDDVLDRELEEETEAMLMRSAETDDMRVLSPVSGITPAVQPEGEQAETAKDDEGDFSTCRYDGIDMPALDLENLDFESIRPSAMEVDGMSSGMAALTRSLDDLAEQSGSYSDNEKQLLEQMRRMQQEHQTVVATYEDKINDLMSNIHELRSLADILHKGGITGIGPGGISGSPFRSDMTGDPNNNTTGEPKHSSGKGPPVPPPPPPPSMISAQKLAKPTKSAIKPRVKMRPLFWNRIILEPKKKKKPKEDSDEEEEKMQTFWHSATEPNFDVDEFERLFGRSIDSESNASKSLHDSITSSKGKGRVQVAKILEENRSRAVGIKLRSMHCGMEDIRYAVYNMDFSMIELDSLYSLYEVRGTKDELDKINVHIQAHEDVPVDQPEQFLMELSQMSHFPERIECMVLKKRFNETLFNIDQQLSAVRTACEEIKQNDCLKSVLELVLAFGNYMNGGTQRGQADGFELTILAKLKDVKSMDNHLNLLHYIVRVYCLEYEEDAGKNGATFPLPDPSSVQQAANVSFIQLDAELNGLEYQLKTHGKKAELVCLDTESDLLQPFKDQMDDFFESADEMLRSQQTNLTDTRAEFQRMLGFLAVKDTTEQVTPEAFFGMWHTFLDGYRQFWKEEQKVIARQMFEKIEQRKKERIRSAKRRKSVVEDGKSNMKQRFAQMRRRSEHVIHANFLRSQSVGPENVGSDGENLDGTQAPRRRRVRPQSEVLESHTGSESMSRTQGSEKGETMAERMQRRRRSRVGSEEVITSNANLEQIVRRQRQPAREQEVPPTTERAPRQRREREVNAIDTTPASAVERPSDRPQRRRRSQQTAESDAGEVFTRELEASHRPPSRRRPVEPTEDNLETASQASYEPEKSNPAPRRRRSATVEAPPLNPNQMIQSSSPREDHVPPANTPRTRQFYRGAKSDIISSISEAAKHKLPRDRSPLPTSPTNAANHFSNLMMKNRTKYMNNNNYEGYEVGDPGYSSTMSSTHSSVGPQRPSRTSSPNSQVSNSSGCSSPDPPVPGSKSQYSNPYARSLRAEEQGERGMKETASKASYREALRKLSRAHANSMFDPHYGHHEQPPLRATHTGNEASRPRELSPTSPRIRGGAENPPPTGRRREMAPLTRLR